MNSSSFFPPRFFPLLAAVALLLMGVLACAGSAAPQTAPGVSEPTEAPSGDGSPAVGVTAQPAMPERRYIKLEFPPKIRVGDSDLVKLTLEVDDKGNIVPTAEVEGNVVTGQVVEIPNLYETHRVIAETRFDIAGLDVRPSELISEPIAPGQTAVFYWSVHPTETGIFRGTIWLYFRFVDKVSGEESRNTASAQIVEIEAVNFLGLPVNVARSTGVVGSILGTIIGFPFFEDIVKFLFGRRKIRKN